MNYTTGGADFRADVACACGGKPRWSAKFERSNLARTHIIVRRPARTRHIRVDLERFGPTRTPRISRGSNVGISFPTGSISEQDEPPTSGGTTVRLPYPMQLDVLAGLDFEVPSGPLAGIRFAVEAGLPVYQRLDGPQLETDWTTTIGAQYAF